MNPEQWQEHVQAYLKTHQSKRAYAEQHNLVYSQFLYWYRKHSDTLPTNNGTAPDSSNSFVNVTAQPKNLHANAGLGTIEFPGGIRLVIHHADLLQPLLAFCMGRSV